MERETVMEMQKTSERTTIHLPQGTLGFHRPLPERARLLVLGGRAPAVPWLQEWRRAWPSRS